MTGWDSSVCAEETECITTWQVTDSQHSKGSSMDLSLLHCLSHTPPSPLPSPPLPSLQTYSRVVLLVDFDGFVSLCCQQAGPTVVKLDVKDASLAVDGARLHLSLKLLEVVAASPVPKKHGPIVRYTRAGRGRGRAACSKGLQLVYTVTLMLGK